MRAILPLLSLSTVAQALYFFIDGTQPKCFFEDLHKGDRMTVTFQVADREFGRAGDLHIDFWVRTPTPAHWPSWENSIQMQEVEFYKMET